MSVGLGRREAERKDYLELGTCSVCFTSVGVCMCWRVYSVFTLPCFMYVWTLDFIRYKRKQLTCTGRHW